MPRWGVVRIFPLVLHMFFIVDREEKAAGGESILLAVDETRSFVTKERSGFLLVTFVSGFRTNESVEDKTGDQRHPTSFHMASPVRQLFF